MQTKIIDGSQAKSWLLDIVDSNTEEINFCSAYIKISSVEHFFSTYQAKKFNGTARLLARWKAVDLASGASDLEVYEFCKKYEIDFHIKENFHGKLYQAKPGGILIGSFNLTNSGFSLREKANEEAGANLPNNEENIAYIDNLFINSQKVDDVLFLRLQKFILQNKDKDDFNLEWPEEIKQLISISARIAKLSIDEFFFAKYELNVTLNSNADLSHDLSLLGINIKDLENRQLIKTRIGLSTPYKWLKNTLNENNGELNFGTLSARLHECLADDPRPYRRDVKKILQNLLTWVSHFCGDEILVDQPNYSQRIRLLT